MKWRVSRQCLGDMCCADTIVLAVHVTRVIFAARECFDIFVLGQRCTKDEVSVSVGAVSPHRSGGHFSTSCW